MIKLDLDTHKNLCYNIPIKIKQNKTNKRKNKK